MPQIRYSSSDHSSRSVAKSYRQLPTRASSCATAKPWFASWISRRSAAALAHVADDEHHPVGIEAATPGTDTVIALVGCRRGCRCRHPRARTACRSRGPARNRRASGLSGHTSGIRRPTISDRSRGQVDRRRVQVLDLEVDDPARRVADRPVDADAVEHRVERADEPLELRLRDLFDALRRRADEVAQGHQERALCTSERLRLGPRHHERADAREPAPRPTTSAPTRGHSPRGGGSARRTRRSRRRTPRCRCGARRARASAW